MADESTNAIGCVIANDAGSYSGEYASNAAGSNVCSGVSTCVMLYSCPNRSYGWFAMSGKYARSHDCGG